jgi:6-phospho-beta-glucosidase
VQHVFVRCKEVTAQLLDNEQALRQLYNADLFDPLLIRTLKLIPSEYLFFYYSQRKAYRNQMRAGASRGEEIARRALRTASIGKRLERRWRYRRYLMQRNASYFRLEAEEDPHFERCRIGLTLLKRPGYHKIAVEVMSGLRRINPARWS